MGVRKTVFHTLEQHILAAQAVIANTQLNEKSCSLVSLPTHHVSGLAVIVRAWASGGKWLIPPKGWTLDWAVREHQVTHVSLVGTQLRRMMRDAEERRALSKLKAITLGGSAIAPSLVETAWREGLPIVLTYGMTESASQVTATRLGDSLKHCLSSGRCLSDRKLWIESNGEIVVSGAMLSVSNDFKTGDYGYLDSDGYLHVQGRLDNRFISGGENIYPEEIERALLEHPEIEQAIVVPREDLEYGQRPVAFVRVSHEQVLNPDAVIAFLRERLERFKVPRDIRSWPLELGEGFKPNRNVFATWIR
ncbi:MAG: AMP-binding protein [Myxococcaceae bacterium]|nr:AMP-binding protein [Myxococcaceae bacterium]MBH2006555.1 AMP-binding protein [Myxococcaceae bacterium]